MKKYIKILVPLLVVLVLAGLAFKPKSNYLAVSNKDEYNEVMAEETAYLYFGRDTCKYCRAFQPLLDEAMEETGTEVYQYDTDEHKGESDFQDILDANEVVTVPKLVKLVNGEIVDYVDHTHSQTEIVDLLK